MLSFFSSIREDDREDGLSETEIVGRFKKTSALERGFLSLSL